MNKSIKQLETGMTESVASTLSVLPAVALEAHVLKVLDDRGAAVAFSAVIRRKHASAHGRVSLSRARLSVAKIGLLNLSSFVGCFFSRFLVISVVRMCVGAPLRSPQLHQVQARPRRKAYL